MNLVNKIMVIQIQSWTEILVAALQNVWYGVVSFLPSLVGALIVLAIGLVIASVVKIIIEKIIAAVKVDAALKKIGLAPFFERAGLQINSGKFLGLLVYWFLVIVFVLVVTDILGLYGISLFLKDVLSYIPNIIVAVLIMLASIVVANFLKSLVRATVSSAGLPSSRFLGTLAWWAVAIFGLLAALIQVGVAVSLINTLMTGFVAMIALAGGIAFGIGGKDYAAHLFEKLRRETEER